MTAGRARDAGSATVLVLACWAVLAAATAIVIEAGLSVAARHHLAAVADTASLAAAAVVDAGPDIACAKATSVARHNGATVTNCEVAGPIVTVRLSVHLRWPLAWLRSLALNSRAGPAETNMDHLGQDARAS
jgi:secretion/DNA translocation related TadE-like protein